MTILLFAFFSLLILIAGCSTRDESIDFEHEKQTVRDLYRAMLLADNSKKS